MNICFKCKEDTEAIQQKHGLHKQCFKEWFNLIEEEDDFQNLVLRREASNDEEEKHFHNTSFFHGKFEKYSAELGKKNYILKLSREYPELARSEYLCNQIGKTLELDIPKNHLICLFNERDSFISYNFMQNYKDSNLEHIWHFLTKNDQFTLETLLKIIEKQTGRLSEIRKFIKICLFDALIGNHDRHGRNLGLISTVNGYVLAPSYDNPSYFAMAEFLAASHSPKCAIATSFTQEPMMEDYVKEFIRLGYGEEIQKFKASVDYETLNALIKSSFISEDRKNAFLNFIKRQYQEMDNVL
ncbi:MAG: HipA domain-containing protein [Alphaproteobacteria bacterium]|nr:HipA domain-containing protein [Alphaproteobacteria bacterium]